MKGYPTSYAGMFREHGEGPMVARIEIPLIQRDYAQGRRDQRVNDIRTTFVEDLHQALTEDDTTIGLDFIYGEVNDGTFEPLDGQQRLTTLFLLHWYLAFRRGPLGDPQPWTEFTYATRPSARLFCERIVENPPPPDLSGPPSLWIKDQSWYLYPWRFDPSIDAMLVMADAIADRFQNDDPDASWERLKDEADPAVWFQLLPIDEMGSAEDLYIKMNSRGKPLTDFEAFKARLGQTIAHARRAEEFGRKIDGAWADLLWPYRGDNDIVDDEFMNYFAFVLEICEWREGRSRSDAPIRPERRAQELFGENNPRHREHLAFFFDALDVWADEPDIRATFEAFFTISASTPGIRLFGASPQVNLFRACCERYGATRGTVRAYSLTDTQLLYATLVHRIHRTPDAARRLRQLRNVNEASQFELRVQNMPKLIAEVEDFMRSGSLDALATFNQNQVADEHDKQEFLAEHPELEPAIQQLEDQPILRGTLAAFDLDAATVAPRAAAFEAAFAPEHWPALTGALLATGEYQRDFARSDYHLFGSPATESVWRAVLVDRGDRASLARTRAVLASFLDTLAASNDPVGAQLEAIVERFVEDCLAHAALDWRYYLVRYPWMREGNSGIYYGADHALGYELTMLRKSVQRSWYRDPYLYAIWRESGSPQDVTDPRSPGGGTGPWFIGYSTDERWMRLERSGTGIRSVPTGIAVQPPAAEEHRITFESVCQQHTDVDQTAVDPLLAVAQRQRNGALVDTEDRVQKAASFLRELIAAGLDAHAFELVPPRPTPALRSVVHRAATILSQPAPCATRDSLATDLLRPYREEPPTATRAWLLLVVRTGLLVCSAVSRRCA